MKASEIDLSAMDEGQLEKLKERVNHAIASLAERRKKDALEAAAKIAADAGFSLEDLVSSAKGQGKSGKGTKRGDNPLPVKFRNPDDATQTWSGHGRRPKWFLEHIENGVSSAQMSV